VPKFRLEKMLGEEFQVMAPAMHVQFRICSLLIYILVSIQISLHTNWATNPVLREAMAVITGYILLVTTVLGLMHYEGWWNQLESATGGSLVLLLTTIMFFRLGRGQYQDIVLQTVESAIGHMEDAIEIFLPDVVVAEDFGGAIAAFMLSRRIWQGPTLLLSSTHYSVADHAGEQVCVFKRREIKLLSYQ
jgi:hypothetical protein